MAEIFTLPGVELPKDPESAGPNDIAVYCRRLANLIDSGEVVLDSAVIVLAAGPHINVQAIGSDPVRTMGLLGFAQRVVR